MLYASSTLSLACLEVLVHVKEPRLPVDYGWVRIELPARLLGKAGRGCEPADEDWCRQFGSDWIAAAPQPAVEVPSVIIPTESNILLNPLHPEFAKLAFSDPAPFRFDPRLLKLGPVPL